MIYYNLKNTKLSMVNRKNICFIFENMIDATAFGEPVCVNGVYIVNYKNKIC